MIFNKKMIAIAVAFACASSVIAMDQQPDDNAARKGYTFTIPTVAGFGEMLTAGKDKLVSYGYETAGQARDRASARLLPWAQWGADKSISLYNLLDSYTGIPGRVTGVVMWADSKITERGEQTPFCGYRLYKSLKESAQSKASTISELLKKKDL